MLENGQIDRKLVTVSRLFYEDQLNKTDIADRLKISVTHVNRLLRQAANKGIVAITIRAPRFEDLEHGLKQKFALRDVRVIGTAEDEGATRVELGLAASRFFEERVKEGSAIGLGSGRTLFEMVKAIPEKPRQIELFPIAVFAEQSALVAGIDSNTVVNVLWFKTRPLGRAHHCTMFFPDEPSSMLRKKVTELLMKPQVEALRRRIASLDVYFLGCSGLRPDSQLVTLSERYGANIVDLKASGIVGDVGLNTVNANGQLKTSGVEAMLFCLSYNELKTLADTATVVLVAAGPSKLPVIHAGAKARLFNSMITDNETAQALINE